MTIAVAPLADGATSELDSLPAGLSLLYGGNRVARVPTEIASAFRSGDRLLVIASNGTVLHIPAAQHALVAQALARASEAFVQLREVRDDQINRFYDLMVDRLTDDHRWSHIAEANRSDVERARQRGRSTTRLVADDRMRSRMIDGLNQWRAMPSPRGRVVSTVQHSGWRVEQVSDGLGVVAFIFEGRPNVFADATGVLKSGNTAVLRIGSDALGTARAIAHHVLEPALAESGLPDGAVVLIDSVDHAAGWALFSHPDVALAIARGSGPAVAQLGAIARQAGIPVSLHGAGGAWIVADETADAEFLRSVVFHSTDRKVCNTLNTLCLPRGRAEELTQAAISALEARGEQLGFAYQIHFTPAAKPVMPTGLFSQTALMRRAGGDLIEPLAVPIDADQLGHEWEWEQTPDVTLHVVDDMDEAVGLFNQQSSRFVASLISHDRLAHERFFRTIDAPCVGNGMTRWLDGQFALERPELGLTNWQDGRLFGRHSILTGDGVYTVRLRVTQSDPNVHQ